MRIAEALEGVRRVFLDTAPVIYYVERNPAYISRVDLVFERLDKGLLQAATSPVTLAECLVIPCRLGLAKIQADFREVVLNGPGVLFVPLGDAVAQSAAQLRARHNLSLTDAFQVAAAIAGGCDALLTNDAELSRIQEIKVLVLGEFEV